MIGGDRRSDRHHAPALLGEHGDRQEDGDLRFEDQKTQQQAGPVRGLSFATRQVPPINKRGCESAVLAEADIHRRRRRRDQEPSARPILDEEGAGGRNQRGDARYRPSDQSWDVGKQRQRRDQE